MADTSDPSPAAAEPGDPPGDSGPSTRRTRHTAGQRAVLGLNLLVILACFAGAVALLVVKNVRESFVAAPHVTFAPVDPIGPSGSSDTNVADTSVTATRPSRSTTTAAPGDTAGASAPPETFPEPDPRAENFLITGDDNNACVDPSSPWAGAVQNRESLGSRSDTIMVLRLDPVTKAAAVLSFPRDLWVHIPGRADQRINTTYEQGRYDLMAATLDRNFGVRVDHFVQIDFCAFKTIVDAVGGVSVPFNQAIRDPAVGLDITDVGACHQFVGDEALAYVRSRHLQYLDGNGRWTNDPSSDLGRITRQQDFLRRMLRTALDKGLLNPSVARGLLEAARKYVVFDNGFSIDDMLAFAGLLRDISPASISTYQIQAYYDWRGPNSVLIPLIDGSNMQEILAIFRGKAPLAGAPTQVADTTTTAETTTTTTTNPATTTPADRVGRGTTSPSTSTPTTSTSTTDAPPPTNPEDITQGVVPDKNAQC